MTITLTIDSVDQLPDGGPIAYQARNRGFEIGRAQHLDWTLPDPSKHISGLHCDIRFERGGYFLYDVSSNGTYLNGSTARMKSPHRLQSGDRLSIGHYVVRVEVAGDDAIRPVPSPPSPQYQQPAAPSAFPVSPADIWDTGAPAPPPMDRRDLMPEKPGVASADYANQFISFPAPGSAERPAFPADPFGADPYAGPPVMPKPVPRPVPPVEQPVQRQRASGEGEPMAFGQPVAPVPPLPPAYAPSGDTRGQGQSRFLEGLAAGAGVAPGTFSGRDPGELGFEIGEFLKVTVEQLAQLLRARAAAKAITKSSSRTMISAVDNNPLKFIPVPAEIIDVMFTRKRPGFLGSRASLEGGFGDLKRHELATFQAMQKALSRLLDDLSPETISDKVGNSAFASKKSRSWDLFVTRWETKTEPHENGMLDVFFAYFAEAYDEVSKKG